LACRLYFKNTTYRGIGAPCGAHNTRIPIFVKKIIPLNTKKDERDDCFRHDSACFAEQNKITLETLLGTYTTGIGSLEGFPELLSDIIEASKNFIFNFFDNME
jgi:hypothetical protein